MIVLDSGLLFLGPPCILALYYITAIHSLQ